MPHIIYGVYFMSQKGLDFKHKEVVNITDGRRLRICTRCNSRLRNRNDYIYYCTTEAINYLIYLQEIMILLFHGNKYVA